MCRCQTTEYPRRGSTRSWQNRSSVESQLIRVRVRVRPSQFMADSKHRRHRGHGEHIKTTHASNATPPGHLPLSFSAIALPQLAAKTWREPSRQVAGRSTRLRSSKWYANTRTSYAIL
ncbi:hypothetical protein B0H67DRAFT_50223 [Lasiosphaeris hirsuta]|uniref:Uncharacterized protein n=1 Tax=Lasiosphaeris hirsuta TaxID=260670 RepID=A0AA40BAU0_9PEZI|nr:hypothetical protein B0H67DRAFT_50223 [Lasiosphaeris hirsuta]